MWMTLKHWTDRLAARCMTFYWRIWKKKLATSCITAEFLWSAYICSLWTYFQYLFNFFLWWVGDAIRYFPYLFSLTSYHFPIAVQHVRHHFGIELFCYKRPLFQSDIVSVNIYNFLPHLFICIFAIWNGWYADGIHFNCRLNVEKKIPSNKTDFIYDVYCTYDVIHMEIHHSRHHANNAIIYSIVFIFAIRSNLCSCSFMIDQFIFNLMHEQNMNCATIYCISSDRPIVDSN